jgi:hypothetical protein
MNRAAWSDIATAPDDGTPVLISRLTTAGRETLIAYFTDHWAEYFSGEQIESAPTHWMALPADPDDARAVLAALRTAPSPELEDLRTHATAWRGALVNAQVNSRDTFDIADKSYWQHEIETFDRVIRALTSPAEQEG